ncbi:hypothetical protein HD597_012385 [Nonomuraea thailandensis]|uniref:Uncharacterized protein n=1 Tax=Nonomuraea thailandensis TaxID=1188745 RepID=A0A9X2KA38_9ACTN|nr:hypothetical protein [Nonomuraea thailandensis]MCP2365365.1 hypothetical protein [Nonomuraea thailandensis]
MSSGNQGLRRTLVVYAFALACVSTLVVGIVLVTRDETLTAGSVLSAIGLNLIASVVFAAIFTLLSTRVQERSLEQALGEQLQDFSARFNSELARANESFLPTDVYPPLDPVEGYGDKFNVDMTRSLGRTDFYAFRGPSARYVAARLRESQRIPQQVKVAMLRPGDRRSIARRASDRRFWARSRGKTPETLEAEVYDELVMSVISLFDYRHICPVDLLYTEDTAVYRFEMFDDAVYVSWFHGPQSSGREMPESMRFSANSFHYKTLRLDLIRRFEISTNKVTFDASQDDEFLMSHLTELIGKQVIAEDLSRWRQRYNAYVGDFVGYLRGVGGQA